MYSLTLSPRRSFECASASVLRHVLALCVLVVHPVYHVCSICVHMCVCCSCVQSVHCAESVFNLCTVCSGETGEDNVNGGRARFSSSCPAEIISTITAATTQLYTVLKEQQRDSEKKRKVSSAGSRWIVQSNVLTCPKSEVVKLKTLISLGATSLTWLLKETPAGDEASGNNWAQRSVRCKAQSMMLYNLGCA